MPALQEILQLAALFGAHAWAVGDCICCSIHCPGDALTAMRPLNHCMAALCLPLLHDVHHCQHCALLLLLSHVALSLQRPESGHSGQLRWYLVSLL